MLIDPTLLKKISVVILVIVGLFIGYKLLIDSKDKAQTEQGYAEEDINAFNDSQREDVVIDDQMGKRIQFSNSFEHTNPGVSSEIIVNAGGFEPGEFTIVYVKFAGTEDYIAAGGQEHTADSEGKISTRFTITKFGDYEVFLSSKGESFTSPVIAVK